MTGTSEMHLIRVRLHLRSLAGALYHGDIYRQEMMGKTIMHCKFWGERGVRVVCAPREFEEVLVPV